MKFSKNENFEENIIYYIIATATVTESNVSESFNLIEAKPNTVFYHICNKLEPKNRKTSKIQIPLN